jgi:hypothetical protein
LSAARAIAHPAVHEYYPQCDYSPLDVVTVKRRVRYVNSQVTDKNAQAILRINQKWMIEAKHLIANSRTSNRLEVHHDKNTLHINTEASRNSHTK